VDVLKLAPVNGFGKQGQMQDMSRKKSLFILKKIDKTPGEE
jgi:hypothetical protein